MTIQALEPSTPEFKQSTGIRSEDRKAIAEKLGVVLADTYMLFIKTQGVHWNVTGPAFFSIHKLTEEHYENLYASIDELAERIRALGMKAPASYTKYGELSSIKDVDEPKSAGDMIKMLIADHETTISTLRSAVESFEDKKDFVTADMLTTRLTWHEQAVWMLNAIVAE